MTKQDFDPYATLEALEGRRVAYVLIGAFARVVQGTEELTRGLDPHRGPRCVSLGTIRYPICEIPRSMLAAGRRPGAPMRHGQVREGAGGSDGP